MNNKLNLKVHASKVTLLTLQLSFNKLSLQLLFFSYSMCMSMYCNFLLSVSTRLNLNFCSIYLQRYALSYLKL